MSSTTVPTLGLARDIAKRAVLISQFAMAAVAVAILPNSKAWSERTFQVIFDPQDGAQVARYWFARLLIYVSGQPFILPARPASSAPGGRVLRDSVSAALCMAAQSLR